MFTWFHKHPLATLLVAVLLLAGWFAFRPELLFVNKTVNEPFPTSAPAVTNPAPQRH
jgi:hypothetical protein